MSFLVLRGMGMRGFCLQGRVDAEQVEGAFL